MEYLFPEMYEGEAENTAKRTSQYPAGAEQYPELVRILDNIYEAGKNLKQSEDTWTKFVPVFDQAQKWFSKKGEDHVKLPKGLTWTRIKDWAIDIFNLGIGRRQFERRLRAHREIGNQPEKQPATVKRKKNTAEALACADAMVAAYRAGRDMSPFVTAYERVRSGEGVPAEDPANITADGSAINRNPDTTVVGKNVGAPRVGSATKAGAQPKSSGSSSEPISLSRAQSNVLNLPNVAAPAPARSAAKPSAGSSNQQKVRVVPFKRSAQGPALELNPTVLRPFGDGCLHSLTDSERNDGSWEFHPDRLYKLLDLKSPQRIFVSETYDLLDERVPLEVTVEHLRVFAAVPWVFFSLLTANTQRLGQIQSVLNSQRMSWPRNLEVGLIVTSTSNIDKRLKAFNLYRVERKWVCFLPFESSENHPMSRECPSLPSVLEQSGRPRIVVGGRIDRQSGRSSLSAADAGFLVNSAKAAGSKIFYCTESAKLAFERGDAEEQIIKEINLDRESVKGTIAELAKYREIPEFRLAPVGEIRDLARNYDSVQRFKPVNRTFSQYELMCGPALQP